MGKKIDKNSVLIASLMQYYYRNIQSATTLRKDSKNIPDYKSPKDFKEFLSYFMDEEVIDEYFGDSLNNPVNELFEFMFQSDGFNQYPDILDSGLQRYYEDIHLSNLQELKELIRAQKNRYLRENSLESLRALLRHSVQYQTNILYKKWYIDKICDYLDNKEALKSLDGMMIDKIFEIEYNDHGKRIDEKRLDKEYAQKVLSLLNVKENSQIKASSKRGKGREKEQDYFNDAEIIYLFYLISQNVMQGEDKERLLSKIRYLMPVRTLERYNLFQEPEPEDTKDKDYFSKVKTIIGCIRSGEQIIMDYLTPHPSQTRYVWPFELHYYHGEFRMDGWVSKINTSTMIFCQRYNSSGCRLCGTKKRCTEETKCDLYKSAEYDGHLTYNISRMFNVKPNKNSLQRIRERVEQKYIDGGFKNYKGFNNEQDQWEKEKLSIEIKKEKRLYAKTVIEKFGRHFGYENVFYDEERSNDTNLDEGMHLTFTVLVNRDKGKLIEPDLNFLFGFSDKIIIDDYSIQRQLNERIEKLGPPKEEEIPEYFYEDSKSEIIE